MPISVRNVSRGRTQWPTARPGPRRSKRPLLHGTRLGRCRSGKRDDRLVDGLCQSLKRLCDGAWMLGCKRGTRVIQSRRLSGIGTVPDLERIPERIVEQGLDGLLQDNRQGIDWLASDTDVAPSTQR